MFYLIIFKHFPRGESNFQLLFVQSYMVEMFLIVLNIHFCKRIVKMLLSLQAFLWGALFYNKKTASQSFDYKAVSIFC